MVSEAKKMAYLNRRNRLCKEKEAKLHFFAIFVFICVYLWFFCVAFFEGFGCIFRHALHEGKIINLSKIFIGCGEGFFLVPSFVCIHNTEQRSPPLEMPFGPLSPKTPAHASGQWALALASSPSSSLSHLMVCVVREPHRRLWGAGLRADAAAEFYRPVAGPPQCAPPPFFLSKCHIPLPWIHRWILRSIRWFIVSTY